MDAAASSRPPFWTRRQMLSACLVGPAVSKCLGAVQSRPTEKASLITRGVVLLPEDLSLADWPERARAAGLTTLAIHHQNSPQAVVRWIRSDVGQRFLEKCKKLGLQVEYELHAMKELLPRSLFPTAPELFRMDDQGKRQADSNCCVHSQRALETIAENAVRVAGALKPTTGRYFFWGDDGQPWCLCPKCRELSPSEQALVVENHLVKVLKTEQPKAQVAHLAYANTLAPPVKIRPAAGVFLEYAPINRRYDIPYDRSADQPRDGLEALDANLRVFPRDTAQVLEYWLDVSRFSHWQRPAVKLPWRRDVFLADIETYRQRGIRHITSFGAWIDADYAKRFDNLEFIDEYGRGLAGNT